MPAVAAVSPRPWGSVSPWRAHRLPLCARIVNRCAPDANDAGPGPGETGMTVPTRSRARRDHDHDQARRAGAPVRPGPGESPGHHPDHRGRDRRPPRLHRQLAPRGLDDPLHLHTRYEERLWVVSGSLTVWAGPDKVTLGSGDYYRIPTDVPHTIRSGPEDTHALHISTPAGFAELIARAGTPAHLDTPDTEFDAELFMAVTTELGDVVLGPPGTMPPEAGRGA